MLMRDCVWVVKCLICDWVCLEELTDFVGSVVLSEKPITDIRQVPRSEPLDNSSLGFKVTQFYKPIITVSRPFFVATFSRSVMALGIQSIHPQTRVWELIFIVEYFHWKPPNCFGSDNLGVSTDNLGFFIGLQMFHWGFQTIWLFLWYCTYYSGCVDNSNPRKQVQ